MTNRFGVLLALLLSILLLIGVQADVLGSSVGIIGGADGPTAIYISTDVPGNTACATCNGTGTVSDDQEALVSCPVCGGNGIVSETQP